jgi:tetratricopeptide (TPR) repeat protein
MSTASPPALLEKSNESQPTTLPTAEARPERSRWIATRVDGLLVALFLILTFLLGAFPLKDADIYWHLRTGDLIRQTGKVPHKDIFTFTQEGTPWIDLHWVFQVSISWLHEKGGVVALNIAKCVVTCLAMLILLLARKRTWPMPVIVLAWLPALLVLSGRIYVRPETLTLLYLSIFLAVILRWDRFPLLAFVLPVVQVAWVNSQGLFVLGPIVLGFGLVDAALRFGIFAPERRRWWKLVLGASVATGLACLVNPYGINGALYPVELARTMSDPIFSQNVAELTSIPDFIRSARRIAENQAGGGGTLTSIPNFIQSAGLANLPLQLHLLAMLVGGLSFLIPLGWQVAVWLRRGNAPDALSATSRSAPSGTETAGRVKKRSRTKSSKGKLAKDQEPAVREAAPPEAPLAGWRLSPFRLLLYAAFSLLSLQATRNSHQFAALVGAVTAWNFAEWAAAIGQRREKLGQVERSWWALPARPAAIAAVAVLLLCVGTGQFFRMTGEGRTIGLGEDALWFPHGAAKFAGKAGMPSRFLSFHNGHAALFEYYHGPERKVYIDPRLEVAGPDLFRRYNELGARIKKDTRGWEAELSEMQRPVILADHFYNSEIVGTLLRSHHWRCVWFDAIVSVFVHDSYGSEVRADAVDFAARHFSAGSWGDSRDSAELIASSNAIKRYVMMLGAGAGERTRPLAWLGLDDCRRLLRREPDSIDGWTNLGVIELFRELPREPRTRFHAGFDPINDLSIVRATCVLRHALELAPHKPLIASTLRIAYDWRLMHEAAFPLLDRTAQNRDGLTRADYESKMGKLPPLSWKNLSELDQVVTTLVGSGRAESAVSVLEKASAAERAPWDIADRIGALRFHLGQPALARFAWERAVAEPIPGLREARIGTSYLAENDFESARKHYRLALDAKADLFEALYCLAVLEQDAGNAAPAFELAKKAVTSAPDEVSRSAARLIASSVVRFARPVVEMAGKN